MRTRISSPAHPEQSRTSPSTASQRTSAQYACLSLVWPCVRPYPAIPQSQGTCMHPSHGMIRPPGIWPHAVPALTSKHPKCKPNLHGINIKLACIAGLDSGRSRARCRSRAGSRTAQNAKRPKTPHPTETSIHPHIPDSCAAFAARNQTAALAPSHPSQACQSALLAIQPR